MVLLRRHNYKHIKLTQFTRNERVGVLTREGHFVEMPWAGFIEQGVAKVNRLTIPVRLDVVAYKDEENLAGDWIKVPEFYNVQGYVLGRWVYGVVENGRLKIVESI